MQQLCCVCSETSVILVEVITLFLYIFPGILVKIILLKLVKSLPEQIIQKRGKLILEK